MNWRALPLGIALAGCAYYNSLYDANRSLRAADAAAHRHDGESARALYTSAAAEAETSLARRPNAHRTLALYLAGRGAALSGNCARGEPRLVAMLAAADAQRDWREHAELALATCMAARNAVDSAIQVAAPLERSRDDVLAHDAAALIARTLLTARRDAEADAHLAKLPASDAGWLRASLLFARGDTTSAMQVATGRTRAGECQALIDTLVRARWAADTLAARALALGCDQGRARSGERARVHQVLAELERSRDPGAAHTDALLAERLATDTVVEHAAAGMLLRDELASATTFNEVARRLASSSYARPASAAYASLDNAFTLARILDAATDKPGAGALLAAQVVRDSLGARSLAESLFVRLEGRAPGSPFIARALLAAAALDSGRAEDFRARVQSRYSDSPYALVLTGHDPVEHSDYLQLQDMLHSAWATAVAALADTIAAHSAPRAADSASVGAP